MKEEERDVKTVKLRIIDAGYKAIDELVKIAGEKVLTEYIDYEEGADSKISADKMKNAAAAKKTALFDAFEILERIKLEEESLVDNKEAGEERKKRLGTNGFAEEKAKSSEGKSGAR